MTDYDPKEREAAQIDASRRTERTYAGGHDCDVPYPPAWTCPDCGAVYECVSVGWHTKE